MDPEIVAIRRRKYEAHIAEQQRQQSVQLAEEKLKQFFQKYGWLFDKKQVAGYKLTRFVKKNLLPDVCNLSNEQLSEIPGIYRMRIKMNSSNLKKPEQKKKEQSYDNIIQYDSDNYDNVLNFSNLGAEEIELEIAIRESLQNITFDNEEDIFLQQIIQDSMINENDYFWICIDLRMYGPDPSQPIFVGDILYYFDFDQMNKIRQKWNIVNPESVAGIRKHQDIEYVHAMYKDIYN